MTTINLINYLGKKQENQNQKNQQFHMDIAASIQSVLETILIKITKSIYKEYKLKICVLQVE